MPPISKRAKQLKKAREIQAQKLKKVKEDNDKINEQKIEKQRNKLTATLQQLSDKEIPAANHLLTIMRYPKGVNAGNLLSPYLQTKAYNSIANSLYRHQLSNESNESLKEANNQLELENKRLHQQTKKLIERTKSLGAQVGHLRNQKSQHISEIRSLVRKSSTMSNDTFKTKINSLFMINKRKYTSNTVWLATSIAQVGEISMRSTVECIKLVYEFLIGEPPQNWMSKSTLQTWHKDVSQLYINNNISQIANAPAFGVMVDESTRGEIKNFVLCYQVWSEKEQAPIVIMTSLKDIPRCNSETVSNEVIQSIREDGLDITKCILWVTDNTAYMASNKKGAVALFNKKTGLNALRIGCGLHIMQIILSHFEEAAFGKLSNSTGFSRKLHPYNLLYLSWNLHDGYNSSDRDKPLNLNASIIKELYDGLMGFHYNQYQLPLRSRWGYELQTAKQYLNRHEAHILFAHWFIIQLEDHKNTPKTYLNDWRLFESWLTNSILNIQIKCLVNFAEHFYEPLVQFMVGQDPNLRIIQNGQLAQLPCGRRAHEMPDKVYEWKTYLETIKNNVEMFFADELSEAVEILSNDEFEELFNNLENGINTAYEYFEKWLDAWLHLPLAICRLGGNYAHSFANSFRFIILKREWKEIPTDLELRFAKDLENDVNDGISDTFGLQEILLSDKEFDKEFEEFCNANNPSLYDFPLLYNFVKTRIYFIIIHQQQVEGLFNKLDLKTHANMSLSLKQSKLRLASSKIEKDDLAAGLEEVRAQRRKPREIPLQERQPFGEEVASNLFSYYILGNK
ncbi:hypothetical protein RhiirA1_504521 [Rhizophagus irregularis]|uniref:Uncharacterized protein n=1 Tax=Rhizophagus irregularis TaxID=588596 RepID=A0A2N0QVI2_9GLOM|nr:hypothetical protein RhiirA1_504521 [Rhizophagus irregularis]